MLAYQFSSASGFADAQAVVGADLMNEPWWSYVAAAPGRTDRPAGRRGATQDVLRVDGPGDHRRSPNWLLFFQDSGGGYNAANPRAP